MKFNPQSIDPMNRNDFINKCFEKNGEHRHKYFKCFFTLVNPTKPVPEKNWNPTLKLTTSLHTLIRYR